jgi:hypothetical protein
MKTLVPTVSWLLSFDFLSLKNAANVHLKIDPDLLVKSKDPRIRARTKMSWVRKLLGGKGSCLCSGERVAEQDEGDKGEDGDEDGGGRPQVHAQRVQVLPS